MIGSVGAVDARGAAELGDDRDRGLAPGRTHPGFDRRDRTIECAQQRGEPAADRALVLVGVPAVIRERANPRSVGPRQKFCRSAGGFREKRPHLRGAGGRIRLPGRAVLRLTEILL